MYAVQSALAQLAEALAADMIDPKRANSLLSVLRLMSLNFRHPEKWQTNLYHSDQPAEIDIAQEFGLPRDLDLDTPPEVAFPQPDMSDVGAPPLSPSFGDRVGAPLRQPESRDLLFPTTAHRQLTTWTSVPTPPSLPSSWNSATSPGCKVPKPPPFATVSWQRNRARRELRSDRRRYADLALRLNLKKAAERLVERRVAEKLAEAGIAPAPASAEPLDFDSQVAAEHEEVRRFLRRNRRLPRRQGGQNRLSSSRSESAEVLKGHSFSCAVQVF